MEQFGADVHAQVQSFELAAVYILLIQETGCQRIIGVIGTTADHHRVGLGIRLAESLGEMIVGTFLERFIIR